jgi:hypothetical protein
MPEDVYRVPVVGGAHCTLEGRDNYIYAALDIRIILYYKANNKTNLILLLILGDNVLDNLYLLNNCRIYGDNGGYAVGCCIYIWLLISILDQTIKVDNKKVI